MRLKKLINSLPNYKKSDLANEMAEPHPDMNIKVAAFTLSEKSSYLSTISAVPTCTANMHVRTTLRNHRVPRYSI